MVAAVKQHMLYTLYENHKRTIYNHNIKPSRCCLFMIIMAQTGLLISINPFSISHRFSSLDKHRRWQILLVVLVSLVVDDVEELELVDTTGGGNDTEPVTELLLLEELLGEVLQVAAGEVNVGNDLNLTLALLLDNDVVAEVVGAALNLDAVLEELLEGGDVEDLVRSRLRSVDDELRYVLVHLFQVWSHKLVAEEK